MKKRILILVAFVAILAMVFGLFGSGAWFSDVEKTENNTFAAGTLDLKVNGADAPVMMFNLTNMRPGNQPTDSIGLKNTGSVPGTLSITGVVLTDAENNRWEPEIEAGDITEGAGELQDLLNLRLYIDNAPVTGYFGAEDVMLYSGPMSGLPSTIAISKTLAAGEETHLNYVIDWWSSASDNLAQSDSVKLDMIFGLVQVH